jgi:hypothetical protein
LGTSGALVVAVVVLGPALTVPVDVLCAVCAAEVELVAAPVVVELLEWAALPQPAISRAATTVAQSGRRTIGAL